MHRIIKVKPLAENHLWLVFEDGIEGIVNLSHLAGKGVFKKWEDQEYFNSVRINSESHTVEWEGGIDLCPDNLYAKMTGKAPLSVLNSKMTVEEEI